MWGLWESQSQRSSNDVRCGRDYFDWSLGGNYKEASSTLVYVQTRVRIRAGEFKNWATALGVESVELMLAFETRHRKIYKNTFFFLSFFWPKFKKKKRKLDITTWTHAVRPGRRKEPTENNRPVLSLISLRLLLSSHRGGLGRRGTGEPRAFGEGTRLMLELHPRLFNSYEALRGTEWQHIAPCHLWPPLSVWNQWHCRRLRPDQTGGATARGSWLNLERTILACWQIWQKHSCRNTEGYNGLQPTALGSIEAFSFGLSCPALAHPAFFSVSCSHFIL